MSTVVEEQVTELCQLVTANCTSHGVQIVGDVDNAAKSILLWLDYLKSTKLSGIADCLLHALTSSVMEAAACLALGLVRPALQSFRLQLDLALAWLYFKDHPVEWTRVQETGDGFKLKTELFKYLSDVVPHYGARYGLLLQTKTRKVDDPYRLLSAHIHGQSEPVLPNVQRLKDIIATSQAQKEAQELQGECAEFLSDIFWSVYCNQWSAIPPELRHVVESRFKSDAQKNAFFCPEDVVKNK